MAFLARHGRGHRLLPSELPFKANIWALKSLGVERILSVSAVGSLKEKYEPLHMVIPDQFVDRTFSATPPSSATGSSATWPSPTPSAADLSRLLAEACAEAGATYHVGGTYVCMEGPQFSTLAESNLYRSWGMDIIGMTNLRRPSSPARPRSATSTLAMVTDYDCWHPGHDTVTVEQVIGVTSRRTRRRPRAVLRAAVRRIPEGASGLRVRAAPSRTPS